MTKVKNPIETRPKKIGVITFAALFGTISDISTQKLQTDVTFDVANHLNEVGVSVYIDTGDGKHVIRNVIINGYGVTISDMQDGLSVTSVTEIRHDQVIRTEETHNG